jgi:hypothetical protein
MAKMLGEQGLFYAPDDNAYIERWIEKHPMQDRLHLYTAAGMTWNLASKLTEVNRSDLQALISLHLDPYFGRTQEGLDLIADITVELEGAIARFLDLEDWDQPVEES